MNILAALGTTPGEWLFLIGIVAASFLVGALRWLLGLRAKKDPPERV